MELLVDRKMMQRIDQITMENIKIPSMVLMERAALAVYQHVNEIRKETDKILVVCGIGNNGADGIAVARMLHLNHGQVDIFIIGDMNRSTLQFQQQLTIAKNVGVPISISPSYNDYNIVVDAIIGVGLSRDIEGDYANAIEAINQSEAIVVAVDLPSGISADDGSILKIAIKASITVTFGYQKVGLCRYPGREYAGKIFVEDVGFPQCSYELASQNEEYKTFFTMTKEDIKELLPRPQHSNKGTFGTVLVVAGSKGMSGACYFSAKAALRIGAGLVKILTVEENRTVIQTMLPEAVVHTYDENVLTDLSIQEECKKLIHSVDAVIVGPGLGMSLLSEFILKLVYQNAKVPTIIDADGVNLIAKQLDAKMSEEFINEENGLETYVKRRVQLLEEELGEQVILTPHMKEFSRLLHISIPKIYKKFIDIIDLCSYNKVLIYIIKDSTTAIVQGNNRCINTSGNDALATGGSGDVLTGIIGGLIAQENKMSQHAVSLVKNNSFRAACLGVYIHGLTAQRYSQSCFSGSMLASDIIKNIAYVIKDDKEV